MGLCQTKETVEDATQRKQSQRIDRTLEADSRRQRRECKILLLGSSESGKSTIVKQMKIIHQSGYNAEELKSYRGTVFQNLFDSIRGVTAAMRQLDIEPENPENWANIEYIEEYLLDAERDVKLEPRVADAVTTIWNDPCIPKVMNHSNKFYLMDSAPYFFDHVYRYVEPDFLPNETDVLRARTKTTGIYETRFAIGQLSINMLDVDDQRNGRKKWIHCFENVTSIIFCVAINEYDQVLPGNSNQNRMMESIALFDAIVNSRWFTRTSIILFLNKFDLFEKKLEKSPLSKWFPDYSGGNDINKAVNYLVWRFNQVNRAHSNIYPHLTKATDTTNIHSVFTAIQETILQNALKDCGIL